MGSFLEGFVGGFAGSLKENLDRERIASEEEARELRKLKARMELEKEFEQDIIDSSQTRIEGDGAGGFIERRYNKRGQPLGERRLSAAEAQERQMAADKAKAELSSAQVEAEFKPRILQSGLDTDAVQREAARASAANSYSAIEERRLDRAGDGGIGKELAKEVAAAEELIFAAADDGVTSAEAVAEQFYSDIEEAKRSNNPARIRSVVARIKGEFGNEATARRAAAEARGRASAGGSILERFKLDPEGN